MTAESASSSSSSSSSSVELSYGRQAPVYRRRKTILLALLLIGVIAGGYFAKPRVEYAYYMWNYRRDAARWYAASLTWVEPPTMLKYTENPADGRNGTFDRAYRKQGSTTRTGYQSFGGAFVERLPLFYGDGRPALTGSPDQVMLIMHQRTTADGSIKRLIAVSNPRFDGNNLGLQIDQIGALNGEYRVLRGGHRKIDMTGIAGPGEIRIFAGQPDPADISRFSIPFEARGQTGFIDGVFQLGRSFSKDPAQAKIEAEANADVALSIRMAPAATQHTTQHTTRPATQPR
jgi:hypothetical protein